LAQKDVAFSAPTSAPSSVVGNTTTTTATTPLIKSPGDETLASRRSGRAIKRKKFDDEMILVKIEKEKVDFDWLNSKN